MPDGCNTLTEQEADFLLSCRELRAVNPAALPVLLECMLRSAAGDETAVEDFRAFVEGQGIVATG